MEPSWNRPVCCVFPHAGRIPTALIILIGGPAEQPHFSTNGFFSSKLNHSVRVLGGGLMVGQASLEK